MRGAFEQRPLSQGERNRARGESLAHCGLPRSYRRRAAWKWASTRNKAGRLRRIKALAWKETLQTLRDPSSLIVAIVLPALLLFLFGFGISFDVTSVRIGLVIENRTPAADQFRQALSNTPFFAVRESTSERAFLDSLPQRALRARDLRGDFAQRMAAAILASTVTRLAAIRHGGAGHGLCAGGLAILARSAG